MYGRTADPAGHPERADLQSAHRAAAQIIVIHAGLFFVCDQTEHDHADKVCQDDDDV